VLPYRISITVTETQEKKDLLLGGRNKSIVVCDCDGHWSLRRLSTIITSYLRDRLACILSDTTSIDCTPTIPEMAENALKRVHIFRPGSTLALATTLMAVPGYHRTRMPDEEIGMLMVDGVSSFYWADRWLSEQMEDASEPTRVVPVQAEVVPAVGSETRPQLPPPPPLRSDANPLRHVLTIILQLRRSLGIVTLLTNWGLTLDSQLLSSIVYFRQHLRAPYPSPFESEPRTSKFPLAHHITIPLQGPKPFDEGTTLEDAVVDRERDDHVKGLKLRAMVRTVGKRPGEARAVLESEFEFAITEDGVLVS
jgi:DNA-repair protein XRCC2